MNHTIVTSFSPYGYQLYGRNFIESFDRHWPRETRLVAFVEDGQEPIQDLIARPLFNVEPLANVAGWSGFDAAIQNFPLMCGDTGKGYSIDFDSRMARKSFIQAHAVKRYGGKIFWIDADVLTHAPVPASFLDRVLPDAAFCCYLGRRQFYTESGFLGFNASHPMAAAFFDAYLKMFTTGAIFTFERWHDCIAFDAVRRQAERQDPAAFVDLGHGVDTGPGLQVFVNSVLGDYMDHLKGARKRAGHSPLSDLTIRRDEPYWSSEAEPMAATR